MFLKKPAARGVSSSNSNLGDFDVIYFLIFNNLLN
jgi:hypothetical protein